MTDEQASDWEYKIICCLGISTSNSDVNVVGLHKTVTELYEQGRADEREAQVCCGDYEKCMKACTPRGRWLANQQMTRLKQEKGQFVGGVPSVSQQREWVGLTDEEREAIILESYRKYNDGDPDFIAVEIQAKLKEKNT